MKNRTAMMAILAALVTGGAWTWLQLDDTTDRAIHGAFEAITFVLWYALWRTHRARAR